MSGDRSMSYSGHLDTGLNLARRKICAPGDVATAERCLGADLVLLARRAEQSSQRRRVRPPDRGEPRMKALSTMRTTPNVQLYRCSDKVL